MKSFIDDSVITFHEIIDKLHNMSTNSINEKTKCNMDYYIFHNFLLVTILLLIIVIIFYYS